MKHVFVEGSIADKALIDKVFVEYKPSVVVNLAAQAGVRYSIDHPDVYIESNLIGFYNILEACRNNPVEHLVYASSSSVYGGNKKVPFAVEDKVDNDNANNRFLVVNSFPILLVGILIRHFCQGTME